MAPADPNGISALLSARRDSRCPSSHPHYRYGLCLTSWDYYGRWIFAGIVIFLIVLFALGCACLRQRRRRRMVMQPAHGPGWAGQPPPPHAQGWQAPPPPAYGAQGNYAYPMQPQPTGNTMDGYYGQTAGIQQPKNTYGNHSDPYAPPPGPPPHH